MGTPGNKTLPADGSLTPSPTQTVGDMQTDLENWLSGTRMMVGGGIETKTIATGSITGTLPFIKVDTEGAAATDDLDFLVQTNYTEDGRVVAIVAANDARTVVVRHNISGSGKFLLANAANFSIDDDDKVLLVRKDGTTWVEVGRFFGADGAALRAYFGYGTAVNFNQGSTSGASPANLPRVDDIVGRQSIWIPVNQMMPAAVNGGAAVSVINIVGVQIIIGNLADGSELFYAFHVAFPKRWNNGTITYEIYWLTSDNTANVVKWRVQAGSNADNELNGYGTPVDITDTNNGSFKINVTAESAALTVGSTPSGNREMVNFLVSRLGADAADTLAAVAALVGIKIFYTSSVLNDA